MYLWAGLSFCLFSSPYCGTWHTVDPQCTLTKLISDWDAGSQKERDFLHLSDILKLNDYHYDNENNNKSRHNYVLVTERRFLVASPH